MNESWQSAENLSTEEAQLLEQAVQDGLLFAEESIVVLDVHRARGVPLTTVWPGQYDIGKGQRRPSHIHIKVSAPGFEDLTTQMYFEGDPHNASDRWFDPSRAVNAIEKNGTGLCT